MLSVSRLRRLFELENRPPISISSPKEKTRRWRDHFFFFFGVLFSDIIGAAAGPTTSPLGSPRLLFRRRIRKKHNPKAANTTTTIGTAMAACNPELHDTLSQLLELDKTPALVLAAAFETVADVP